MATAKRRKQNEVGTARAHVGAPHNQPFNISGKKPGVKKHAWFQGYKYEPKRAED